MDECRLIASEDELLAILASADPKGKLHQVYRSQAGTWHYTYSGRDAHRIAPHLITALVGSGVLHRVYNDTGDAYWLGQTMDIDATVAERSRTGDSRAIVYEARGQRA